MRHLKMYDLVNVVLLTAIAALVILFVGQMPDSVATTTGADAYWYQRTAEAAPHLYLEHRQPFAYRLLGPYLIGILPIPQLLGFRILSILGAIALANVFYSFLRYAGLSAYSSFLCVTLLIFNRYVYGFTIWTFTHVNDFLMMVFIVAMFLSMWKGHWFIFSITLVLGAMTREPTMLMVPVALFYVWEKRELKSKWHVVLLACLPGLITLFLIRSLVPIVEGRSLTLAVATFGGKLLEPASLFRLFINTFLPFTLLPLLYLRSTIKFFRENIYMLVFVILVFVTTLFGSNQERLMAPACIVFFLLLGTIFERVTQKRLTFFVMLLAAFLSSFHYNYGNWQVPDANWTRALTLGSMIVITLYMALFERNLKPPRSLRPAPSTTDM